MNTNKEAQAAQLSLRMPIVLAICNSRAACGRWLFQTWKFWRFACSHCVFNLFAR